MGRDVGMCRSLLLGKTNGNKERVSYISFTIYQEIKFRKMILKLWLVQLLIYKTCAVIFKLFYSPNNCSSKCFSLHVQ